MADIKITTVTFPEGAALGEGFKHPSKYYFVCATGDRVYIHTRDRARAQKYIEDEYGGRYTLRADGREGGGGTGCRASMNSASLKGARYKSIMERQGTFK